MSKFKVYISPFDLVKKVSISAYIVAADNISFRATICAERTGINIVADDNMCRGDKIYRHNHFLFKNTIKVIFMNK